ncbi:embryonic stem cell-specific 5-hydroxymethylcytosine-binding protein isoform X2 [Cephus cinctus]|uniref:Abasic site processing protein HMCES n=1 Tax=Cephus cinctus TaxID=211228 RepID=A0AAJ7CC16_CEPCN|nr:embryonic stem cell-specific 5-hydroxymethylcytosine-binding protein isoform X2 [Cephus cinctus]
MCGRTACTLDAETLKCVCGYKDATGRYRKAEWQSRENAGRDYQLSYNIAPTDVIACVVAGEHFDTEQERVLYPMIWGMIPPYHKGDYRKHNLSTHNCRVEGMRSSKLYSTPLNKGFRCVVVCTGYFEWEKTKEPKQPYFFHAPQREGVNLTEIHKDSSKWTEKNGWEGVQLLKLAGIFNAWKSDDGHIIYSCTIITMEANKVVSWMHKRCPAILQTEDDVVPLSDAVQLLRGPTEDTLKWYPVGTAVNNSRYKDEDCIQPIKLKEKKESGAAGLMASWLNSSSQTASKRRSTDDVEGGERTGKSEVKRAKKDQRG